MMYLESFQDIRHRNCGVVYRYGVGQPLIQHGLYLGPQRPHTHQDPTKDDFWYPPYSGPCNQNVRSSYLYGRVGP